MTGGTTLAQFDQDRLLGGSLETQIVAETDAVSVRLPGKTATRPRLPAWHRLIGWKPSRVQLAVLILLFGSFFSLLMLQQTGLARRIPPSADSFADWLVTRAFFDGLDPYTPLEDLAKSYDIPYVSPLLGANPPAPRLPGAFLVEAPMLLTTPVGASQGMVALGCVAVAWALWRASERRRVSWILGAGYMAIGLVSGMALWGFGYINTSIVIVGMMVLISNHADDRRGGLLHGGAIAIAATLKVFPLILLFAMARRRKWATVGWGAGIFLALNLLPLVTPQVSVDGVMSVLAETFDTWFSGGGLNNVSMLAALDRLIPMTDTTVALVQVAVLALGLGSIVWRQPSLEFEQGALLLLGLMATAIVWPHYMLLALPFLLLIVANPLTSLVTRVTLIGCTLLLIPARPSPLWPLATVMMFVALVMDGGNERTRLDRPKPVG